MATFAKAENALKRAEELINVGQKQDALQALHDLITSKRCRSWQKTLERIMFKHVELCVDMRRGRYAKDGLIQYRIVCQQVNVASLEEVIKHFMHLSTERAEMARNQAQALEEALNIDDLEADKRPEDLMLSYFRRLCEIIRNHLANLNKYKDQRDRPDLSAPESLQLYLDTRFEQLKIATELELWQEAFCSVEDKYGLMCMVKKTPKPSLMVVYHAKLTEIFWHPSVVLAALSIAPYDNTSRASHLELEHNKEWNLRMANLMGIVVDPKSKSREVVSKGVMTCVTQEVKDLYYLLECEFFPLDLSSKIQHLLIKISKLGGGLSSASSIPEVHLAHYVPALEKLATLRLLQQVSQVYQTIKIESLSNMIPFFGFSIVEKVSVDAVKQKFITMKLDHTKGIVAFGNLALESNGVQDHLMIFAESSNKARAMTCPPKKVSKTGEMLPGLMEIVEKEHKRLLFRKSIIEKRKEDQERHLLEMERVEESKRIKQKQHRLLLQEAEKRGRKKGKKPLIEGEKLTKQTLMELALNEQLWERQKMEKKLQKLAKMMDYLERAKREEESHLIKAAFHNRLVEEKVLHGREQQQEIELSRQQHDGDLKEKSRLARMMNHKMQFQERVLNRRQADRIIKQWKKEREYKRKMLSFLRTEEERRIKQHEEEEARKHEEAERKRKEEAERRAKPSDLPTGAHPTEAGVASPAVAVAVAASATTGKYVPRFRREQANSRPGLSPEPDRWGSNRQDGRMSQSHGDSWRSDDCRPSFGSGSGSGSRSCWTSSRR
ncbi:hypothetical protein NMG60_11020847 [Bertholletia excelsa]